MPPELEELTRRLIEIAGGAHVLSGPAAAEYAVDGVVPRVAVRPGSQAEVEAVAAACAASGAAMLPWGGGTAVGLGNPPARADVAVSLERLTRVVEFDAANLNITVEGGVPLSALQATIAEGREFLPLDPPRADRATVGGIIATNASGPGRLLYGTARDLVLGLRVVLPSGERIRCGGKVIKNVSGYDMNKVFIGSLGTLGIVTEVTFKLLPLPAMRAMVAGVFGELPAAVITRTLESFWLPEALELLDPQALKALAPALGLDGTPGYGLAVSLAGSRETVERQVRDFAACFTDAGALRMATAQAEASVAAWQAVRDVFDRLGGPRGGQLVCKIAVPISKTAALLASAEALARRLSLPGAAVAHAGSGVVRAAYTLGSGAPLPDVVRDGLDALRREAEAAEGSLIVETAPLAIKRHFDAWGKPGEAFVVMQRLKAQFDPRGLMNPGRFLGGI
jgi:glycolate oxidase FAD binding subunit